MPKLNSTSAQQSESEQDQREEVQLMPNAIALAGHLFWGEPPTGPETRCPPCDNRTSGSLCSASSPGVGAEARALYFNLL